MKNYFPLAAFGAVFSLTVAARADFSFNFNTATPSSAEGNFADQQGWTITDPEPNLSFLVNVPAPAYGAYTAGLGGYYAVGTDPNVTLSHTVGEDLAGYTFSLDFAVINRLDTVFDNTNADDNFEIFLRGTGFDLTLSIEPPAGPDTNVRNVGFTGSGTTGSITTSDGNFPAFYKLSIEFTANANGVDLDYFARIDDGGGSGGAGYVGTLVGQADASIDEIGASFIAGTGIPDETGLNYLLLDNINFTQTPVVPEAGSAALAMLALGTLGMRRRR